MKCPVCGAARLVRDTRDLPYTYKGETTVIVAVTGDYCPSCEEVVLDAGESGRVSSEALAFNKEVNASLIDPREIAEARQVLNLGQREAGALFGGGVNAFNRYEAGKIKPPRALVQLLRLLRNHPELLEEVRHQTGESWQEPIPLSVKQPVAGFSSRRRK